MTDWMRHLLEYKKKHNCTLKEAMKGAKDSYVKKNKNK